nr:hypothetical protein Iba_chr14cCG11270 [Ipomoea batatas]
MRRSSEDSNPENSSKKSKTTASSSMEEVPKNMENANFAPTPSSKLYAASETVLEIRSVLDWTREKLSSSYLNHLAPSDGTKFPIVFQLWKRCKSGKLFINQKIVSYTNTQFRRPRRWTLLAPTADVAVDLRFGVAPMSVKWETSDPAWLGVMSAVVRRWREMAAAGDGDDKKKLTYLVATAQSSTPHLSSFVFGRALEQ